MPATETNPAFPIGEYYTYYPTWFNGTVPTIPAGPTQFYGFQDEIFISGVSGRFPESENIEEFSKFLYGTSKNNLDYFKKEFTPMKQSGKDFDYSFFGFSEKEAQLMDTPLKWLFETTYEAIYDSGFNPIELKGTKTGVFIGTTSFDGKYQQPTAESTGKYSTEIGSYYEFNGPFFTFDTTYSSGLIAFDKAINAIRTGACDQAIVAGVNFNFEKYGQFEENNNYGTVGVVFIQKSGFFRRFYAKVMNTKSTATPTTGEKDAYFTSSNGDAFVKLLRDVFAEANIDPNFVSYYESHGYEKKYYDSNEYKLIAEVFAKNRNVPLFVGSTKATDGYEHGMISLVKMLIAAQKGIIPASLKYHQPTGEYYKKIEFVNENTKFYGGLMALNSFGYSGTSVHIVLQPNSEQFFAKYGQSLFWNQDMTQYNKMPRLFSFSARTEEGLQKFFSEFNTTPADLPTHYLLNPNAFTSTTAYPYRGYTIFNLGKQVHEFKKVPTEKRPLWWFFNGFGGQWTGMGKEFMQYDFFATTMYKIADFLKPYGFDLRFFLSEPDYVYDKAFYALVLTAAFQVAFIDFMKYSGITPDGIVGYSFGEYVAAYADNALTMEETMLSVYYLGKYIDEAHFTESSMATIGLSYDEAIKQCPQGVVVSFYETKDTVVVSGPKKTIQQYVEQLKLRGIYALETDYFGLGLHSYLMAPIASKLKAKLETIIHTPKLRSPKWYSTSSSQVAEQFKYASSEYFVSSLINPIYFYQVFAYLPKNSIAIEFGPHAYLQPNFAKLMDESFTYINFMNRDAPNQLEYFWTNFGRLYNEGYNIDAIKFFLPYRKDYKYYPVPSYTKFLSPFLSWYRPKENYFNTKYEQFELPKNYTYEFAEFKNKPKAFYYNGKNEFTYTFDISKGSEYYYFTGHQVNGKLAYPTGGYLYMVWNAFATMLNSKFYELPVEFENLEFFYPTYFEKTKTSVEMVVRFLESAYGRFEVFYNNKVVASGRIYLPKDSSIIGWQEYYQSAWQAKARTEFLEQNEIYKEFKIRGYEYTDVFQGIYKSTVDGFSGELFWNSKWLAFFDAMIQTYMFGKSGLQWPTYIYSVRVDPRVHAKYIRKFEDNKEYYYKKPEFQDKYYTQYNEYPDFTGVIPYFYDEYSKTYVAGGVEMSGFYSTELPKTYFEQPVTIERFKFVPYNESFGQDSYPDEQYKPDYEYIDSYLNEIRYYVSEILSKIEFATTFKPTSVTPSTSFDSFSSYPSSFKSYTPMTPPPTQFNGKLVDGKFLQLLKDAYKYEVDSQYLYKVKQLFGDKMAFYKTWKEDPVFYYSGGRYTYLKSILDTVYENNNYDRRFPKLKVLEIAPQFYSFGPKVNELFSMYPSLNIDYYYAPTSDMHPELYNEWVQQSPFPITKVDWNLKTQEMPPSKFKDFDLVIFNASLGYLPFFEDKTMLKKWLQTISDKLIKPQGFFLVHEFVNHFETLNQLYSLEQWVFSGHFTAQKQFPVYKYQQESEWKKMFEDYFYPVAFKQDNAFSVFYLYRKFYFPLPTTYTGAVPFVQQTPNDFEIYINETTKFDWIEKVKEALENTKFERVWLICEKPAYTNGMIGFVNSLRFEPRGERIRCIFVTEEVTPTSPNYNWKTQFDYFKRGDLVMNVYKYGKWGSYRHLFDFQDKEAPIMKNTDMKNAYVNFTTYGDLSTLKWMQAPEQYFKDDKKTYVNVMFGGLNYRDYLMAKGLFNPEYYPTYYPTTEYYSFGMEFSGYVKDKRYMGVTPSRGLSTILATEYKYLWEIPQTWTFEQAATVPFAYTQAYYALVVRGGLKYGETVLINYGATTFGQAAISVALSYNCKVFTTVETKEEREYLMTRFPGKLFEESFLNLYEEYFDKKVMRYTQGKGVNVVLNWFNGEFIQPSLRSLATYGRFIEMGDYSFQFSQYYRTLFLNKSITLYTVFYDTLFSPDNNEWQQVYKLFEEGVRTGYVRPFTSVTYDGFKVQEAFKYFIEAKNYYSKVLIKIGEPKMLTSDFHVVPKVYYSPYWTYIITGGLTPFSLEFAQWMVERGARKLFFTSRTGVRTSYQQRKIQYLQKFYGATVNVTHYDAKNEDETVKLFKEATEMSEEKKIGGIFHFETAFTNNYFEAMKPEQFQSMWETKYISAYNLDKYSREFNCYFVVFSSYASGYGYPGATAYAWVNSAIERLCELRRQTGKYALAIQWGTIGEFDSAFETTDSEVVYNGTVPQKIYSVLNTFEYIFLRAQYNTIWSSYVPTERTSYPKAEFYGNATTSYMPTPYTFYPFTPYGPTYPTYVPPVYPVPVYPTTPTPTTKPKLYDFIYKLLGLKEAIYYDAPLVYYGLNPTLACELKSVLEKWYQVNYSISEVQQLTFDKIKSIEQTFPYMQEYKTNYSTKYNYLMPKKVFERLNEVEMTKRTYPVFVVHPIEGHVNMLKSWAKYMKYPVYGIQYTNEAMKYDSIEKLADFYLQQIDQEFGAETRFHLAGYSFGGSVAFEMAFGKTSRVASFTFLDGSYMYVNPLLSSLKTKYLNKDLPAIEAEFLYGFISQYTQTPTRIQFVHELTSFGTYDSRVDYAIKYLMKATQFHFEAFDLEQAARSYVQRMFMSFKYQPKFPLKYNEVLLVKPAQKTDFSEQFGEDYGLSNWIQGRVFMQMVDGDQRSFMEAANAYKVAMILNEYFSRF